MECGQNFIVLSRDAVGEDSSRTRAWCSQLLSSRIFPGSDVWLREWGYQAEDVSEEREQGRRGDSQGRGTRSAWVALDAYSIRQAPFCRNRPCDPTLNFPSARLIATDQTPLQYRYSTATYRYSTATVPFSGRACHASATKDYRIKGYNIVLSSHRFSFMR